MKKNCHFLQELDTEEIQCMYHGTAIIEFDDIAFNASHILKQKISYYVKCKYRIPFFISHLSVSSVFLSVKSYSDKTLCGYETSLSVPCTLDDLRLFYIINDFIEKRCRESTPHRQMIFDRCVLLPGAYPFDMNESFLGLWQKLMKPFFKHIKANVSHKFRVDNGKLHFIFSQNKFIEFNNCNESEILDRIRRYIWQDLYFLTDKPSYSIFVLKGNGTETREYLTFVEWHNNSPITFGFGSYLLIKNGDKWQAIKPKKWIKVLSPYFHQYDDEKNNLIPVMPSNIYAALKEELTTCACSLNITFSIDEGLKACTLL